MASVRAYKEHRCEYVFQYESLDLAEYADAFNLLRVPKMKELREGKINGFVEEKQHIVEKIAFADKAREKQRQIKLLQILKEKYHQGVEKSYTPHVKSYHNTSQKNLHRGCL